MKCISLSNRFVVHDERMSYLPEKRSLWILNHYAISPDMSGGTRHYDLSKALTKKGYEVTIFASGFDHVTKKHVKIGTNEQFRTETWDGVRFVWVRTLPYYRNDLRRVLNMLSYGIKVLNVSHNFSQPDVIIGSSMHPFAVLAAWWLARRYKAKFVFEVRDLWPQTPVDMGAMSPTSIIARTLYSWEKLMYQKADKIIVLLPYAEEYIQKRGIKSDKIVYIPNGVDLNRFDKLTRLDHSTEVSRVLARYQDKFKLIYLGSHGIPNGLDTIIDAACLVKEVPDIHFIFIGEGTEKERLINKANELNLNNITFCGSIPKEKVTGVLQSADCFIVSLPKFNVYKYGVSLNKLFDYCASGKPIILAGNPRNNIIKDTNAGISVDAEDSKALADAILNMYRMPLKERMQLGKNGRVYVEKHHSTKILADRLSIMLDEILE